MVCCTSSGKTWLRAARERPQAPVLSRTPHRGTARRLTFAWGVHALQVQDVVDVDEMTRRAVACARSEGFARTGQLIVAVAGMPFGHAGTTNLLRIALVD